MLFKFKYTRIPNKIYIYHPQLNSLEKYLYNKCHILRSRRGNMVNKTIMLNSIKKIAQVFGFDFSAFITENFSAPSGKNYLIINEHRSDFKSKQQDNPWMCNTVNSGVILMRIFKRANFLHKLNSSVLQQSKYRKNIKILPKKDIKQQIHVEKMRNQLSIADKLKLKHKVNTTKIVNYPYARNYRTTLQPLWSPYNNNHYFFTAKYSQFQDASSHNNKPAILLQNIKYHNKLVTDHILLFNDDMLHVLNSKAKPGDNIIFSAIVTRYVKNYSSVNNNQPYLDFTIKNLDDIRLIDDSTILTMLHSKDDKAQLLEKIGKLFNTYQLKYLLIHKKLNDSNTIIQLNKRITPLKAKLKKLEELKKKLHHQSKNTVEVDMDNSYNYRLLKAVSIKLSSNNLVSNISNKLSVSSYKVTGLIKKLEAFAYKMPNLNIKECHNLSDVKYIYNQYRHQEKRALSLFYNSNNDLPIHKIEDTCGLSSGTLLKLRKKHQKNQVDVK